MHRFLGSAVAMVRIEDRSMPPAGGGGGGGDSERAGRMDRLTKIAVALSVMCKTGRTINDRLQAFGHLATGGTRNPKPETLNPKS